MYLESAGDGIVAVRGAPRLATGGVEREDSAEITPQQIHAWLADAATLRVS